MVVGTPTPQPRKTFTPGLLGALAALAILAVVTVIVVVRSGGKSPDEKTTASSSSQAAESSGSTDGSASPSADTSGKLTSSNGAFTYTRPPGYEDAEGKTGATGAVAQLYKPSSDSTFPTTIIVSTEPTNGDKLETAISNSRKATEQKLSTTTDDLPLSFNKIDGEVAKAYFVNEYQANGTTARSAVIMTIHKDELYAIILNAKAENSSGGGDDTVEFIKSIKWT